MDIDMQMDVGLVHTWDGGVWMYTTRGEYVFTQSMYDKGGVLGFVMETIRTRHCLS